MNEIYNNGALETIGDETASTAFPTPGPHKGPLLMLLPPDGGPVVREEGGAPWERWGNCEGGGGIWGDPCGCEGDGGGWCGDDPTAWCCATAAAAATAAACCCCWAWAAAWCCCIAACIAAAAALTLYNWPSPILSKAAVKERE